MHAIPRADWLPPESNPNKYHSQLVLTRTEGGSGPLCIVGRELQLVWYATERDRANERHGRLVCVRERTADCHGRPRDATVLDPQQPALEELSSPQLDMVFDVMSFLYRSIPGMELMAELRAQGIQSPRG